MGRFEKGKLETIFKEHVSILAAPRAADPRNWVGRALNIRIRASRPLEDVCHILEKKWFSNGVNPTQYLESVQWEVKSVIAESGKL